MHAPGLALFVLLISPAVFAQTTLGTSTTDIDLDSAVIEDLSDERTQLQVRAGLGLGTLSNNGAAESTTGINVGAAIDLPVANGSSLLMAVNFVQKGASSGSNDARINYIVIPIQLKAHFGHPRAFRWNLGIGPYVGIKTAAYNTASNTEISGVSGYDIGGRASLGLDFPIQPGYSLLAGADYDFGATKIVGDTRTRAFLMSLGIGVEI